SSGAGAGEERPPSAERDSERERARASGLSSGQGERTRPAAIRVAARRVPGQENPSGTDPRLPGPIPSVPPRAVRGASPRERRLRAAGEWIHEKFLFLNSTAAIVLIGLIFIFLFRQGLGALRAISLSSFWVAART